MNNNQRYLAIRTIAKHAGKKPALFEPIIDAMPDRIGNIHQFDEEIDKLWARARELMPKKEREAVENEKVGID